MALPRFLLHAGSIIDDKSAVAENAPAFCRKCRRLKGIARGFYKCKKK
jgi:hypothetical protein